MNCRRILPQKRRFIITSKIVTTVVSIDIPTEGRFDSVGNNSKKKEPRLERKSSEKEEYFRLIRLGVHNINSIKGNSYKIQEFLDYCNGQKLNVVGITETNIKEKEAKFLELQKEGYKDYWSSAEQNKHKGSRVGILVDSKQSKHITKIE